MIAVHGEVEPGGTGGTGAIVGARGSDGSIRTGGGAGIEPSGIAAMRAGIGTSGGTGGGTDTGTSGGGTTTGSGTREATTSAARTAARTPASIASTGTARRKHTTPSLPPVLE